MSITIFHPYWGCLTGRRDLDRCSDSESETQFFVTSPIPRSAAVSSFRLDQVVPRLQLAKRRTNDGHAVPDSAVWNFRLFSATECSHPCRYCCSCTRWVPGDFRGCWLNNKTASAGSLCPRKLFADWFVVARWYSWYFKWKWVTDNLDYADLPLARSGREEEDLQYTVRSAVVLSDFREQRTQRTNMINSFISAMISILNYIIWAANL